MNQEESSTDFKEFLEGMSEHLTELRNRLIVIVLSLCFAIIIAFFFSDSIMAFLARPIGGLEKLQSIEITENFTSVFRVALLAGLVLDSPIIFYEILAFILPALKSNEKRILFTFLPLLILFFIAGILFAFFILLPAAIPFLTCDQPVSNTYANTKSISEVQSESDVELYYPVSPFLAVLLSKKEEYKTTDKLFLSEDQVYLYNEHIYNCSHEQIYSNSKEVLEKFINKTK